MFSVNFVTLLFANLYAVMCKLVFCHDSHENVAGDLCFLSAKQRIFHHDIQNLPILSVTG